MRIMSLIKWPTASSCRMELEGFLAHASKMLLASIAPSSTTPLAVHACNKYQPSKAEDVNFTVMKSDDPSNECSSDECIVVRKLASTMSSSEQARLLALAPTYNLLHDGTATTLHTMDDVANVHVGIVFSERFAVQQTEYEQIIHLRHDEITVGQQVRWCDSSTSVALQLLKESNNRLTVECVTKCAGAQCSFPSSYSSCTTVPIEKDIESRLDVSAMERVDMHDKTRIEPISSLLTLVDCRLRIVDEDGKITEYEKPLAYDSQTFTTHFTHTGKASQVGIYRRYVSNLLADGHMLVVAAPLPSPTSQPTVSMCIHSVGNVPIALDELVSPTHDLLYRSTFPAYHVNASLAKPTHTEVTRLLVLLEPCNVAQRWPRLSCVSFNDKVLPLGLLCPLDGSETASQRMNYQLAGHQLPKHVAIVMDGNGRWAKSRSLPRSEGHIAGVEAIHRVIRACRRLGIPYLTLYAFSAQNWNRPPSEVKALMSLLIDFVQTDCEELIANGIRLLVNGDIEKLPAAARDGLQRLIDVSQKNTGLTLCLALSYGGREEIVSAAKAICRAVKAGHLSADQLTVDSFRSYMPNPDVPDPDLLIRTSGELRISNFLLWQIAYTELYVCDSLWPDFSDEQLLQALMQYSRRERRFGKTSEQVVAETTTAPVADTSSISPKLSTVQSERPSHRRSTRPQTRTLAHSAITSALSNVAQSVMAGMHLAATSLFQPSPDGDRAGAHDAKRSKRSRRGSSGFSAAYTSIAGFLFLFSLVMLPIIWIWSLSMFNISSAAVNLSSQLGSKGTISLSNVRSGFKDTISTSNANVRSGLPCCLEPVNSWVPWTWLPSWSAADTHSSSYCTSNPTVSDKSAMSTDEAMASPACFAVKPVSQTPLPLTQSPHIQVSPGPVEPYDMADSGDIT